MALYKYIRKAWRKPKQNLGEIYKSRLIQWRRESATIRIRRPTRLARARSLGYRAKQGIILVRQRVSRGGRKRPTIRKGRRPKHYSQRKDLNMSYQWVAEIRAQKKFVNCEVLNSYFVGKDGKHYWYEIILVDRAHPNIIKDKELNWLCFKKGRTLRGLTSAARKSQIKP